MGYIGVSGTVTWTGIFGADPAEVQISVFDSSGLLVCTNSVDGHVTRVPGQNKYTFSNTTVGAINNRGKYTIKVQALDGSNPQNKLGAEQVITVTY